MTNLGLHVCPHSLDTLARLLAHIGLALTLRIEVDVATVTLATADAHVPRANLLAEPPQQTLKVDEVLLLRNNERVGVTHVRRVVLCG